MDSRLPRAGPSALLCGNSIGSRNAPSIQSVFRRAFFGWRPSISARGGRGSSVLRANVSAIGGPWVYWLVSDGDQHAGPSDSEAGTEPRGNCADGENIGCIAPDRDRT